MCATLRKAARKGAVVFNERLSDLDRRFRGETDAHLRLNPIIVLGPPRSGSTLIYQVITARFNVCYLSNVQVLFYRFPKIGSLLCRPFHTFQGKHQFESSYGSTRGLLGQSEASLFWDQWIPRSESSETVRPLTELREHIAVVSNTFNLPFVGKSVYACNHVLRIVEVLPEAILVVAMRDPFFVAQSIVLARRSLCDRGERRFSVQPRHCAIPDGLTDVEESAFQVVHLYESIIQDIEELQDLRVLALDYDRVCIEPVEEMDRLRHRYEMDGGTLSEREFRGTSFVPSRQIKLDSDEVGLLRSTLERLWPRVQSRYENRFGHSIVGGGNPCHCAKHVV